MTATATQDKAQVETTKRKLGLIGSGIGRSSAPGCTNLLVRSVAWRSPMI